MFDFLKHAEYNELIATVISKLNVSLLQQDITFREQDMPPNTCRKIDVRL